MSQEIANRPNIAPTPQTREFRDLLGLYGNKIETTPAGTSLTSSAPVGGDLVRIQNRRNELMSAKAPTDPSLIAPRIARLFLRFPSAKLENAAGTMAAYASDLAEFPLWAIEAGIMSLLKGHGLSNKDFAPSSVIVRDAVVREMARVEAELAMINRVLSAKPKAASPPDAERKARVVQDALDFIGGMKAEAEKSRRGRMTPQELAEAKAISDAISAGKPDPRPPPMLSPELQRILAAKGALRPPQAQAEEEVA